MNWIFSGENEEIIWRESIEARIYEVRESNFTQKNKF